LFDLDVGFDAGVRNRGSDSGWVAED